MFPKSWCFLGGFPIVCYLYLKSWCSRWLTEGRRMVTARQPLSFSKTICRKTRNLKPSRLVQTSFIIVLVLSFSSNLITGLNIGYHCFSSFIFFKYNQISNCRVSTTKPKRPPSPGSTITTSRWRRGFSPITVSFSLNSTSSSPRTMPCLPKSSPSSVPGAMPAVEKNYWRLPSGPAWAWWILAILPLDTQAQVDRIGWTVWDLTYFLSILHSQKIASVTSEICICLLEILSIARFGLTVAYLYLCLILFQLMI